MTAVQIILGFIIILTLLIFVLLGLLLVTVWRSATEKIRPCPNCGRPMPTTQTTCAQCAQAIPEDASYLVRLQGDPNQKIPIPAGGLTIGRHPENALRLEETLVSRRHARIGIEDGQYVLYDLESANGTWVNERQIGRHTLRTGDVIQIGLTRFVYRSPAVPKPEIPPVSPDEEPRSGQWIDGYQLQEIIGEGGMAVVFRAVAPDGREVAIKILQETQEFLVDKFVQEGQQIGPQLQLHPHIVRVEKYGKTPGGRHYIVMEYVGRRSLRSELGRPIDDPHFIQRIIGQTCDALSYAHRHGIIHRDIKPENLLLTPNGDVKVADFGVARLTSAVTVTGNRIIGTPEYMSYEQARGRRVNVTSDLYSLGVVLYEMLTGTVPFQRPLQPDRVKAGLEVIEMHIHQPPEPPSRRNPNVRIPPHFEGIALKALEKDWQKRFRSALEMGQAIGWTQFTHLQPTVTYPIEAHFEVVAGPRRGKTVVIQILRPEGVWIRREDIDPGDTWLSRRHAILMCRAGQFWIEDRSTNGTFLNDRRVHGEALLNPGDVLRMGKNELRFLPS